MQLIQGWARGDTEKPWGEKNLNFEQVSLGTGGVGRRPKQVGPGVLPPSADSGEPAGQARPTHEWPSASSLLYRLPLKHFLCCPQIFPSPFIQQQLVTEGGRGSGGGSQNAVWREGRPRGPQGAGGNLIAPSPAPVKFQIRLPMYPATAWAATRHQGGDVALPWDSPGFRPRSCVGRAKRAVSGQGTPPRHAPPHPAGPQSGLPFSLCHPSSSGSV